MSAHEPQDQHPDAPGRPVFAPCGVPSVRDLLASCAAARTVSTPPADERLAAEAQSAPEPSAARPADAA